MIDKISGKVAYAVVSFGGFLGMGEDYYPMPWPKIDYDTSLGTVLARAAEVNRYLAQLAQILGPTMAEGIGGQA